MFSLKFLSVGAKASKRISYFGTEVARSLPPDEYTLPLLAGIIIFLILFSSDKPM